MINLKHIDPKLQILVGHFLHLNVSLMHPHASASSTSPDSAMKAKHCLLASLFIAFSSAEKWPFSG